MNKLEKSSCWQLARELVKLVYNLTKQKPFCKDSVLCEQIRYAAVSVMESIAEGFATHSNTKFIQSLNFAIRSIALVQSYLYVAMDLKYVEEKKCEIIFNKAQNCADLCCDSIRCLKNKSLIL